MAHHRDQARAVLDRLRWQIEGRLPAAVDSYGYPVEKPALLHPSELVPLAEAIRSWMAAEQHYAEMSRAMGVQDVFLIPQEERS